MAKQKVNINNVLDRLYSQMKQVETAEGKELEEEIKRTKAMNETTKAIVEVLDVGLRYEKLNREYGHQTKKDKIKMLDFEE